jgi:hypothetical protein
VAWRYTGSPLMSPLSSQYLSPTEVIQSKLPNPYLYWRGLSPLTVAMAPAQTDFAGEQFQKGLWLNNADTGVVVTTDQLLADDQRRAIESALRERKRKAGTPDRPLFLFGGAKVEKPTLSMMDMQFLETRKFLRQEIFAILKVPETLAGFTADLNDGGAGGSLDAQKASFIESTVGSLCGRIESALARVVETFGDDLVGWFDVDSLPIMQAARRDRWETAAKMFGMGVPMEDINTKLDLGLADQPWYKKGFLPFNLQDAAQAGATDLPSEAPEGDLTTDDTDDTDGEKLNPFSRMMALIRSAAVPAAATPESKATLQIKSATAALWKRRMQFRQQHVNLFKGKIGKVLAKFRAKALAKLEEVHLEKSAGRMNWDAKSLVDIIFSHLEFSQALSAELKQPTEALLQGAADSMLSEIGYADPWKYPPKQMLEYITSRNLPLKDAGETIRNQINTTLEEGVTSGETHLQLAQRVKDAFNTIGDGRAKTIARTEVNAATCKAGFVAMKDVGIEHKSWLGSHGPHARIEHQEVEDTTIDEPIGVHELFDVPNELGIVEQMMQPLDEEHGASAGNIINCQCDVIAAQKTGEDEKSRTFKIFGIGEMKFLKK